MGLYGKRSGWWICAASLAAISVAASAGTAQKGRSGKIRAPAAPEYVPGEVIVKLKDAKSLKSLRASFDRALMQGGGLKLSAVRPFQTDPTLAKVTLDAAFALDASATDRAIAALKADPSVEYAERNSIYRAYDALPDDTDFSKLWGLHNTGQSDSKGQTGTPGADIDVARVWATGKTGSKSIVVAVIDTGVNLSHPDLAANIYVNTREIAGNGIDDDGNGFIDDVRGWNFSGGNNNPNDDNGHGSHCAGTIGGVGNNGKGVAGVNWNVSILPVKFLSASGSGTLEAGVEAINYAAKMGVQIMSNSWGCGAESCNSQALHDSIIAAKNQGILFVAAAGNSSQNNDSGPNYPSNFPVDNMVAVAATDNRDTLASFSSYGKSKVHVAAPGVNVYSTVLGSAYDTYSGTSMATPHVAGIAALLMSADSTLGWAEVKRRLIASSVPVAGLSRKVVARGRVSAYNALMNIEPPRPEEPAENQWQDVANTTESAHPYGNNQNLTWSISVPNAKFIRVVFERIAVEARYDRVTVESSTGEIMDEISGSVDNYVSEYVQGSSAVLRLKSDFSTVDYGFKVAKLQAIY